MKTFKKIRETVATSTELSEDPLRKYLKKLGKGGTLSYTDNDGKTKKTGKYGGLMNRGGRSYAKVNHDKGMSIVPLPQVHYPD